MLGTVLLLISNKLNQQSNRILLILGRRETEMTRKEERKMEKMREKIEEQNQKSSMVVHPGFWGTVADIAIMAVIALVAFICIIPLWHVVMCSVSDGFTLLSHEGMAWKPVGGFTLNGYKLLFQDSSIISRLY